MCYPGGSGRSWIQHHRHRLTRCQAARLQRVSRSACIFNALYQRVKQKLSSDTPSLSVAHTAMHFHANSFIVIAGVRDCTWHLLP